MASLDPQIKSPPFFMPPGHFTLDQMYGLKINDHQLLFFFSFKHMEEKLITALPWICVLITYQTKDCCCCSVASVVSDSVRPKRRQPTRLLCPWDSPGKNTGVGCHFLLQCMKVKRESEIAQSYPTLSDPMDCSLPGSSVHGIFQARVLEWGAIAFSNA